MTTKKPDCTGQRFGRLVVLGKGGTVPDRNSYRQLWRLQCDCGVVIEKPRSDFEYSKQISCGCARRLGLVDNKRRPHNIAGMKFGTLTAIALTGKKVSGKPTWLMQCDCGNTCNMSLSKIRNYQYYGTRINCGRRSTHLDAWLKYPVTPHPYPKDAGKLLEKYLYLTKFKFSAELRCDRHAFDTEIEDKKLDRLIRACWIIVYRREHGEYISELHEKRLMQKHLCYSSIDVFWERKIKGYGGLLYNKDGNKKEIGSSMTDVILNDYPVLETQGIKCLPTNYLLPNSSLREATPTRGYANDFAQDKALKHLRFKRC